MLRLFAIVESGIDVRLVEGLAERFQLSILARRIEGGVEVSQLPSRPIDLEVGPSSRTRFARAAWRRLSDGRKEFDCVLVQGYGLAALAANAACLRTGVPTVMLVCSPVEAYYRTRLVARTAGKPYRPHELAALQALARVNAAVGGRYIVLSRHLAEVVRGHGARGAIETIPVYGVDTGVFQPSHQSKQEIKASLGLPTKGSLIFFSSRIAPEKDAETLLRALKTLLDEGRDLWLLHRSGGYERFLRDAEAFGVRDRIIAGDAVHPHRELPSQYQACDVCVQASREEGLGFSPLEALACRVPVVATAVGGLRETIVDGRTGWTYPVGDVHALSHCIACALDDPAEAARRAAAGRSLVTAQFDRRVVFDQLENFLGRLVESRLTRRHGDAGRKAA